MGNPAESVCIVVVLPVDMSVGVGVFGGGMGGGGSGVDSFFDRKSVGDPGF